MRLLIRGGELITLDAHRRMIQADIAIVDGRIAGIGRADELTAQYGKAEQVLDASGRHVIPGLVNAHTHTLQAAFRGLGDGLSFDDWQRGVTHAAYLKLSAEDAYWFTLVGCIENIRSGVTTAINFQAFPNDFEGCEWTARAFGETGLRGLLVKVFRASGGPTGMLDNRAKAMDDVERVFTKLHGSYNGRVRFCVGPPGVLRAPAEWIKQAHAVAKAHGSGVHTHVAGDSKDIVATKASLGVSPIEYLASLGIIDARFQAAHCVHILPEEMRLLSDLGGHIAHCPVANMYLGYGVANLPEMETAGVNIALGSDGPASNNNQDMFAVMKATSLLQKAVRKDPALLPPGRVLEMATKGGARAAFVDAGTIEPGRLADLAVVDLSGSHNQPLHRPVSALIYSAHSEDTESVVVGGEIVMRQRQITGVDEREVIAEANRRVKRLLQSDSSEDLRGKWPWC